MSPKKKPCDHKIGCLSCHPDGIVECSHCGKEWMPIGTVDSSRIDLEQMESLMILEKDKSALMLSMVEALAKSEVNVVRGVWRGSREMDNTLSLLRDYTIELVKSIHKNLAPPSN